MKRRDLLQIAAGACGGMLMAAHASGDSGVTRAAQGEEKARMAENAQTAAPPGPVWHDVRSWGVEGKGWNATESDFDRLPARAKGVVREAVWNLSRQSAGMCAHFETDSRKISARWVLRSPSLAMPHMPATGVSGLDLYARDHTRRWRFVANGRPSSDRQIEIALVDGLAPGLRAYGLYLPLYNGVTSVEIGVEPGAEFRPVLPRKDPPLVFYGTSILQGGCASRPGMVHTSILGRRLDRPTINLGFSGNGTMDPELATLMAELDASAYILDCLPNMGPALVAERTEPFVRTLRQAHPQTPIVLVEDRTFTSAPFRPGLQEAHRANRAALRKAYDNLVATGDRHLHYVRGEHLFGDDGEAAVDGSHATDLGFMRMADLLEPVLRRVVEGGGNCGR